MSLAKEALGTENMHPKKKVNILMVDDKPANS